MHALRPHVQLLQHNLHIRLQQTYASALHGAGSSSFMCGMKKHKMISGVNERAAEGLS